MKATGSSFPIRRATRWLLPGVSLFAVSALIGLWLQKLEREPKFDGKTAKEWVRWAESFQSPSPNLRTASGNNQGAFLAWHQDRSLAIDRLIQLGSNAAPHMVDWLLERESLLEFGSIWIRRHFPSLTAWLPVPKQRGSQWATAMEVLSRLGPSAASEVPRLSRSLKLADANLQRRAITVLGNIGQAAAPASIPVAQRLNATNAALNTAIAQAIARMGPSASNASPHFLSALERGYLPPDQAMTALWSIGCPPEKIVPVLKKCVQDPNHGGYALTLLRTIGNDHDQVEGVLLSLKNRDAHNRAQNVRKAIESGIDRRTLVPKLIEALSDEWYFVRTEAARALNAIARGDESVYHALQGRLNDSNEEVRETVRDILKEWPRTESPN